MDLEELKAAVACSWTARTSDEPDAWDEMENPQRGQCGATALVIHDYLGGHVLVSEVTVAGRRVGVHYSNQLPNGTSIDLTADQFCDDEVVGAPEPIGRIQHQPPRFGVKRYELLSSQVAKKPRGTD